MKEIKFRYVFATEDGYDFAYYTLEQIENGSAPKAYGPIARNLYTGGKDIRGREIYGGDIVKTLEDEGKVGEIQFAQGYWGTVPVGSKNLLPLYHPLETYDLMGNIWENPELSSLPMREQERKERVV